MEQPALAALAKLDRVLPARLRHRVEALRTSVVTMAPPSDDVDADLLVTLAQACEGHERVALTYKDREGRETTRRVEPYRLVSTGRRWYLLADDVDRQDWRTFRVDRIVTATRTGHRFIPVDDPPDALTLVSEAITSAPYRYQAVVAIDAPPAVVRDRVPPTVGLVEPHGPGSRLTVGGDDLPYLAGHLVDLDLPFEVLEPEVLREHLRAVAARLAAAHTA
jgi:predicted DNA-binding transcriptional regulator YafY